MNSTKYPKRFVQVIAGFTIAYIFTASFFLISKGIEDFDIAKFTFFFLFSIFFPILGSKGIAGPAISFAYLAFFVFQVKFLRFRLECLIAVNLLIWMPLGVVVSTYLTGGA